MGVTNILYFSAGQWILAFSIIIGGFSNYPRPFKKEWRQNSTLSDILTDFKQSEWVAVVVMLSYMYLNTLSGDLVLQFRSIIFIGDSNCYYQIHFLPSICLMFMIWLWRYLRNETWLETRFNERDGFIIRIFSFRSILM